jgi:hypothetical protein
MAWVYLDDQFPDHPKIAAAGGDAGWLFVCGLAYVKRYATEGVIPKRQISRLSDRKTPSRLARKLVEVQLWEDDGNDYRIHDYHDWNRPQANRVEAARKAARVRWGNAKADANALPDALPDAFDAHCETGAVADASTCPPPLPPEVNSSSCEEPRAGPPLDDDRSSRRVDTALTILADRDLDRRQTNPTLEPVSDPDAWTRKALTRRRASDGPHLAAIAAVHPRLTPTELADRVDAHTATGERVDHRLDDQQTAQRAAAERHMAELEARKTSPVDPVANVANLHDVRASLRHRND